MWKAGGLRQAVVVARAVTDANICSRGRPMVETFSLSDDDCSKICSARIGFLNRHLCHNDGADFAVSITASRRVLSESSIHAIGVNEPRHELPTVENMMCDVVTEFMSKRYEQTRGHGGLVTLHRRIRKRCKYSSRRSI